MALFRFVFLILVLVLEGAYTQLPQQRFRRTPDNQTATNGDKVILPCSIANKVGLLQWTRDGFGLGMEKSLMTYERYRVDGNGEEGDYTLVIDPVTLEDDAVFQCQVGRGPPHSGAREIRSGDAKLTVDVPTSPPIILQGDRLQTTENDEIQLECISRNGKPAAEIIWLDGNGLEIRNRIETVQQPHGKLFTTHSVLKLRPNSQHHNSTLYCQAHNRPAKEIMTAVIRLDVQHIPKVSVEIKNAGQIRELDTLRALCKAEANPSNVTYRWFLGKHEVISPYASELVIPNVSRKIDGETITCEVGNKVGKGLGHASVEVFYGPMFLNEPENVEADPGNTITLNCEVEGKPEPEVVWFHEPTGTVVGTAPNITVDVTPDTAGSYVCKAVVQGFPQVSAVATISLKAPPRIKSSRIQYGMVGDTVRLECLAKSVPKGKIKWSHPEMGEIKKSTDNFHRFSIMEDYPMLLTIRSVLVIQPAEKKDFANPFNCTITNTYGIDAVQIDLIQQNKMRLFDTKDLIIWIVAFFIVSILLIIMLCQRRTKPPNSIGEGKSCPSPNHSSSSSSSSNDSEPRIYETRTCSSLSYTSRQDSCKNSEPDHWKGTERKCSIIKHEQALSFWKATTDANKIDRNRLKTSWDLQSHEITSSCKTSPEEKYSEKSPFTSTHCHLVSNSMNEIPNNALYSESQPKFNMHNMDPTNGNGTVSLDNIPNFASNIPANLQSLVSQPLSHDATIFATNV